MKLVGIVLFVSCSFAQGQAEKAASFEVASVKVSRSADGNTVWNWSAGTFTATNLTLRDLTALAYNVRKNQVSGGPKWLDDDRYDVAAKMNAGASDEQHRAAIRELVEDRFRLRVHREDGLQQGYSLVALQNGAKLQKSVEGAGSAINGGPGRITAKGIPLEQLANSLSGRLHAPVADLTGLHGTFDVTLQWSPGRLLEDPADGPPGTTLLRALEEQLGLQLKPGKVSVTTIRVDDAERPKEN